MITQGQQTQARALLTTIQGNLLKIGEDILAGDDSILKIVDQCGGNLRGFLEQPDDSPDALSEHLQNIMALSAGAPSVEEDVRRRLGISAEAWGRHSG